MHIKFQEPRKNTISQGNKEGEAEGVVMLGGGTNGKGNSENKLYIVCILVFKYNVCSHIEVAFLSPPLLTFSLLPL